VANSTFCFNQDATRPYFAVQLLKEKDRSVVDLTSCTVAFYFRHVDANQAKVSGAACNITDAVNGKVEYRWQVGDTAVPGLYNAEFRITFADNSTQAIVIQDVNVQERLL